ncbi:hypothetical protein BDV96DRAFT_652505 [Lophiotrema nucula]|uniref:F-box domain-containing protein n=1 Tax=Lophiotrema nucula TaxID=690887 RepID=A0A6A5YQC5_9PLEO|nr:hypothetical protein BDV96DRAFT_652505 [Lophiotrema nucula]
MTSAAPSALFIIELLEYILSSLSPLQIVSAQAVCRTWRDLIATSANLRELAWLNSAEEPTRHVYKLPAPADRYSRVFQEDLDKHDHDAMKQSMGRSLERWGLNPLLVPLFATRLTTRMPDISSTTCFMGSVTWNCRQPSFEDAALPRPRICLSMTDETVAALQDWVQWYRIAQDVWGVMALCRPAVEKLEIKIVDYVYGYQLPIRNVVRHGGDGRGLTMREFMSAVEEAHSLLKSSPAEVLNGFHISHQYIK